jgi:hypothetical protein
VYLNRERGAGFGLVLGIKKPLENWADFLGATKGGNRRFGIAPIPKYTIGKQGNNLKWKTQFRIA